MLRLDIPGFRSLALEHLVLDFNGTLAADGKLLAGVGPRLRVLARTLELHVLSADTFGTVRAQLARLPCRIVVLAARHQDRAKASYVRRLGARNTVCVGNGRNDRRMLRAAVLGIAVFGAEGTAAEALRDADLVMPGICEALDALRHPQRLVAALRS